MRSGWRRSRSSWRRREASLAKLKEQWEKEVELVQQIRAMREALESGAETVKMPGDGKSAEKPSLDALQALEEELDEGAGRESAACASAWTSTSWAK